jgi:hypothetical protein
MSAVDPKNKKEGQTDMNVWPRLLAITTIIGGAFAWLVGNYEEAAPVLASPAMLILVLFATYGLGGLSAYWLVARPLMIRLQKAEGVIKELRSQERTMLEQMAEMKAAIARHQVEIEYLRELVNNKPKPRARKTPAPKE